MPVLAPRQPAHVGVTRLVLTDSEREAIHTLATELTLFPPAETDEPSWIARARQQSCSLPLRLLEALRHFRTESGRNGTLVIGNLPIDKTRLPPTPSTPDSVERVATVPSSVAMLLGQQLGEVIAFRNEKHGALVQNVVPVPSLARSQSNGGSIPLELHTENAFHLHRPDLIGLLCLRSDREGKAGTTVASIREAVSLLDAEVVDVLKTPCFVTAPPPSFHTGVPSSAHPVLDGLPEDPSIRMDFNTTTTSDPQARLALERLRAALLKVSVALVLGPGEMAWLDNRLVLHGRTEFTPRYDGRDRWLHRVYIHLDSRRAHAYRPGSSLVLS